MSTFNLTKWFNKEDDDVNRLDTKFESKVNSDLDNSDFYDSDLDNYSESETFYLINKIYDSPYFSVFNVDGRDFVNNIKMWACQRKLNKDHVLDLKQSIMERKYLLGTFKIIRNKLKEARCIDGQHRIKALQEIINNDSKFNCDILIEVYDVESFEDPKATHLFIDVNNTLNVTGDITINYSIQNILKKLMNVWDDIIIDVSDGKRCNRPRINKKQLVEKMRHLVINYEEDIIINTILDLNNNMGTWCREILLSKCGKVSTSLYNKSKKSGCYLGLIKDCDWINIIENMIKQNKH